MNRWREHGLPWCAWLIAILSLFALRVAWAEEKLPPKPTAYFNDYAGVVDSATARELDAKLRQYERDTSNQIVVAVFRKMESDSSVFDFTQRIASSWKVGQADQDNGAVLFVFIDDRKIYIQVGYGLEGALPDAICKRIIEEQIKPGFITGNYKAGLVAGVDAMLQAAKGEYKGTGRIAGDAGPQQRGLPLPTLIVLLILAFMIWRSMRRGVVYNGQGRSSSSGPVIFFPGGGGGGGGGWGGGDGGGFSGGGGDFGGGGAGGDW